MPSTFSTIGVPIVDSEAASATWGAQVVRDGRAVGDGGEYRVLDSDAGPQLWAAVNRRGRVAALTPHFAGGARCRARLSDRIERAEETRFEGGFDGWAVAEYARTPEDPSSDVTPLRFDVPDALQHRFLRLPALAEVQIAAFAVQSFWHRSLEEFHRDEAMSELPLAGQAFVYADVFDETDEPSTVPLFSGRVHDTAVRVNEHTGLGFRWALVETLVGLLDVVADLAVVEGEPTPGGIVSGTFWLSGRIVSVHASHGAASGRQPLARWRGLRRRSR